jgi:predicted Zn-dependent peptidase
MGISHLLEHMVFKGTERRSAREIALALEGLGGSLDAYTSREQTSYQARVLDDHLPQALDVLADLARHPRLRDRDLTLERDVVLEEIATVEDTPDDLVFELHGERLWGGHPYGHSILGTRETVSSLTIDELRSLHRDRYVGANMVLAAAGHVQHDDVVRQVERLFGDLPRGARLAAPAEPPATAPADEHEERPGAQTHIVFGTTIPGHRDPARYALVILSSALGAGMSSRLFQRVREELALCYTVFSYQSFYSVGGVTGVYVGTRPEWSDRAVDAVRGELASVARHGLSPEELARTKQQVKGHLMLSLESSGSRLHRLAGFALYEEDFASLDEVVARVEAVTSDQVLEVAERYFDPERHRILRLGPKNGREARERGRARGGHSVG